jgi:hypothetical protein
VGWLPKPSVTNVYAYPGTPEYGAAGEERNGEGRNPFVSTGEGAEIPAPAKLRLSSRSERVSWNAWAMNADPAGSPRMPRELAPARHRGPRACS